MALSRRQLVVAGSVALPATTWGVSRLLSGAPAAGPPSRAREVALILQGQPTVDGAGVHLNRVIGQRALPMLDPFLLLDEFQTDDPNDYLAGFPDHPHRGFETVTYMIHGAMEHKDSVGNHGRLGPGSAQWMTAGHGIVHSEMPKQERGLMWGFQLWVNLPKVRKLIPPRYQDIAPERIPEIDRDGAHVRVVAGAAMGQTGPVTGIDVDPLFLDVALQHGARFAHDYPSTHASFVYVTQGSVRVGAQRREVKSGEVASLSAGDGALLEGEVGGGRVLLLAGRPLGEPVARGGPFVMNTPEEIQQAWADYRSGRLISG